MTVMTHETHDWVMTVFRSCFIPRLTVPQFREFLACGYGTPPALLALMQHLGRNGSCAKKEM